MAGTWGTGQSSPMDIYYLLFQLWALEFERTCNMFHHCNLRLQRLCKRYRVRGTRPFLQPVSKRGHRDLEYHLHWTVWLWHCRHAAPHCCLAYGSGLLEYSAHGQNAPRTSLAGNQELQASAILLVRLYWHVLLRVLSSLHVSVSQFYLHPLSRCNARYRKHRINTHKSLRWGY